MITLLNQFLSDTFLNRLLQERSYLKYVRELEHLIDEYARLGKRLPNRFVIFNFPRSGSNVLCTMLNNNPDILCHHELFNPKKIFYSKDFQELYGNSESISREDLLLGKIGIATKQARNLNPEKFLMRIWQHNYGASAVGFNLFPTHVPNMATSLIKDKGVKKILLIRQNKIKCYVSRAIARKTDSWSNYSNNSSQNKLKKPVQVCINANRLLRWSRRYEKYFNSLRQQITDLNQTYAEVFYEDLVGSDSESIKARLLEYIEVPVKLKGLQPLNKKQNSDSLSDLIINFNELRKKLNGTELETFLDY